MNSSGVEPRGSRLSTSPTRCVNMIEIRMGVEGGRIRAPVARDHGAERMVDQARSKTSRSHVRAIVFSMGDCPLVMHVLQAISLRSKSSRLLKLAVAGVQVCLRPPSRFYLMSQALCSARVSDEGSKVCVSRTRGARRPCCIPHVGYIERASEATQRRAPDFPAASEAKAWERHGVCG